VNRRPKVPALSSDESQATVIFPDRDCRRVSVRYFGRDPPTTMRPTDCLALLDRGTSGTRVCGWPGPTDPNTAPFVCVAVRSRWRVRGGGRILFSSHSTSCVLPHHASSSHTIDGMRVACVCNNHSRMSCQSNVTFSLNVAIKRAGRSGVTTVGSCLTNRPHAWRGAWCYSHAYANWRVQIGQRAFAVL
jgi:hypothetical protein